MSMIAERSAWISTKAVARLMGISHQSVKLVTAASSIRRKELPGMHLRYHRGDIERVAREALKGGPSSSDEASEKESERPGRTLPGTPPTARRARRTA